MREVFIEHYTICLKLIQKVYFFAYSAALTLFSLVITSKEDVATKMVSLLVFDFELPRTAVVFATLFLFILLGFSLVYLNRQAYRVALSMPKDLKSVMSTYPAVSNASFAARFMINFGLVLIFFMIFITGPNPMDWSNALGCSITVSIGYLIALLPPNMLHKERYLSATGA